MAMSRSWTAASGRRRPRYAMGLRRVAASDDELEVADGDGDADAGDYDGRLWFDNEYGVEEGVGRSSIAATSQGARS